jgi:hypothetical protein
MRPPLSLAVRDGCENRRLRDHEALSGAPPRRLKQAHRTQTLEEIMTTTLTALKAPVQPVNHGAVVDGAMRAINNAYDSSEWIDFAQAIRENQEAKEELEELLECGSEEEDSRYAFGIGMAAGMLYAQIITAKATPGAPEGE